MWYREEKHSKINEKFTIIKKHFKLFHPKSLTPFEDIRLQSFIDSPPLDKFDSFTEEGINNLPDEKRRDRRMHYKRHTLTLGLLSWT